MTVIRKPPGEEPLFGDKGMIMFLPDRGRAALTAWRKKRQEQGDESPDEDARPDTNDPRG